MSVRVNSRTVLSVLAVAKSGVLSNAQRLDTGVPLCASHRREGEIGFKRSSAPFTVVDTLTSKT